MSDVYEKLGAFYLGREVDAADGKPTDALVLYDSRDLTTHAVCVGMTGSGKTGLCVSLLEEAAIDGIPAIIIDPKGDLANLALTFPALDAASFRAWVNEDSARQAGVTPGAFAEREAEKWKQGLLEWDQTGERIAKLRAAADVVIYTPGSDAARPVSVVASLAAPRGEAASAELATERASGVAASLLTLLGVDADPVKSREHILLTTILQAAWADGRDMDLAGLVQAVQSPSFSRVGVMELDSFYPAKERFQLAMLLNNLLAAPRFQSWMTGDPIDIDRMLYGENAKPRLAIFSIAHLDDAERMFFVSLLLNEVVGWMRTRSGTSSLRAIVYMDEIFGYLPPVENPPSKRPMLTLLKQARAFGVGVVVATQNPVDLDYKALANTGTWFIGRLQTERDKARLADGLASASGAGLDPATLSDTIGALSPRTFLLHSVHEAKPVLFRSRWALSYLAGPLTREQLRKLTGARTSTPTATGAAAPDASASGLSAGVTPMPDTPSAAMPAATAAALAPDTPSAARPAPAAAPGNARPVLPPDLRQLFEPAAAGSTTAYTPFVLGKARVHLTLPGGGTHTQQALLLAPLSADAAGPDWSTASALDAAPATETEPASGARYAALPRAAGQTGAAAKWQKSLTDALYRSRTLTLYECKRLRTVSKPGESEREFRIRVAEAGRTGRDEQIEKLRDAYAVKLERLDERVRRAQAALSREKDQANSQKMQAAVSVGATLLTAFLGRKKLSQSTLGRATTAARGADRAAKEQRDVGRAEDSLETLQAARVALEQELQDDLARLEARLDPTAEALTTLTVKPKKADIEITDVVLLWRPVA